MLTYGLKPVPYKASEVLEWDELLEAVGGAGGPEEGFPDGEGVGDGWWDEGGEGLPEVDVLGAVVGATGEEETVAAAGEVAEVVGVGDGDPLGGILDEGEDEGGGGADAGAVGELEVPKVVEGGGEELAGGGEEVEVEEGVAEGVGGGEFLGEVAVGGDLVAEGGFAEAGAEGVEGAGA